MPRRPRHRAAAPAAAVPGRTGLGSLATHPQPGTSGEIPGKVGSSPSRGTAGLSRATAQSACFVAAVACHSRALPAPGASLREAAISGR
jgi:hypothetical protein